MVGGPAISRVGGGWRSCRQQMGGVLRGPVISRWGGAAGNGGLACKTWKASKVIFKAKFNLIRDCS